MEVRHGGSPSAACKMDVSVARTVDGPATARCADGSLRIQLASVASRVILAFRSLETGHPALALAASASNFAWSARLTPRHYCPGRAVVRARSAWARADKRANRPGGRHHSTRIPHPDGRSNNIGWSSQVGT